MQRKTKLVSRELNKESSRCGGSEFLKLLRSKLHKMKGSQGKNQAIKGNNGY